LLVLSSLLAIVFLFLFEDKFYFTDWSEGLGGCVESSLIKYYYTLPNVCSALSRQYGLSKREETVLQLLAQKKSGPDIAAELFISPETSKTHIRNIYKKIGVHSRSELEDLLSIDSSWRA